MVFEQTNELKNNFCLVLDDSELNNLGTELNNLGL